MSRERHKEVGAFTHASTRYTWIAKKHMIMPKLKKPDPMMGSIQWRCLSAVQPYQLSEGTRPCQHERCEFMSHEGHLFKW